MIQSVYLTAYNFRYECARDLIYFRVNQEYESNNKNLKKRPIITTVVS